MLRILPIATAILLVIATGVFHGWWTRRWTQSRELETTVARLEHVPMTIGDWHGRSQSLSPAQLELGEIAGYIARRYQDQRNGAVVTILVVCGRPGPISVHTPDICYGGAGFEPTQPITKRLLRGGRPGQSGEFLHTVFSKTNAVVPMYLRILWSWSHSGTWEVPDNPRRTFAPRTALYKLYVSRELTTSDERLEDDAVFDFLGAFLPELERALFATR